MQNKEKEDRLRQAARAPAELFRTDGGLGAGEVRERRNRFGRNCLEGIRRDTVGFRLRRAFLNPFSAVLLVLAVISCFADILLVPAPARNYTTVLIISVMLAVSGCVRFAQELKSKRLTDRLLGLLEVPVRVKRDGQWKTLPPEELVAGDTVRLLAGERVPADVRLTEAQDCFLSESAITGESELQEKTAESLTGPLLRIQDCKNIAFCGTTVVNGSLEGTVIAVGSGTLYGELALPETKRKQGYDRGANSIAWVLIRFMALLVPIVFVASGLTRGNWLSAFLFALSVAVGLTPELLPMVITACLARGSSRMSRRQTVVKNINAMQGFGSMDVLCIDKTGTLTEDTLLLEYYMDVLGNESRQVLDLGYLSSFYHRGIFHPLDAAILKAGELPQQASSFEELTGRYEKLDELPFDYSRRISAVLLRDREGPLLIAKGGADDVLRHCSSACYQGRLLPIDGQSAQSVHAVVDEMLEDGMKVLAVAASRPGREELLPGGEEGLTLLGYLAFFDAPKKTAAGAVRQLNAMQVRTKVLTGDALEPAVSVCRRLGMDTARVLTGRELDRLSDNEIQLRVEETAIFAELSPAQKAKIVETLQSNGHTVGFLADGVNDLPAVLQSDVGISVDTAVPSCQECADVILLKKDLSVLESGITEGRKAFANMSKYVRITASSNLGNIIAIVAASIFLPFFPMTAVQLLLLNLLYDILCLVLPWDRVDGEMIREPLEWSGKSLSRFMMCFGPISSVFDLVTFLFLFFLLCPAVCGGPWAALSAASRLQFAAVFQTGWFLESMWTQVLILQLLRTERLPFLESRPSAPVLTVTLLGVTVFTLLAVTPAGHLIGMTGLPPVYFIFLAADVLCYLLAVTLAKRLYQKRRHGLT